MFPWRIRGALGTFPFVRTIRRLKIGGIRKLRIDLSSDAAKPRIKRTFTSKRKIKTVPYHPPATRRATVVSIIFDRCGNTKRDLSCPVHLSINLHRRMTWHWNAAARKRTYFDMQNFIACNRTQSYRISAWHARALPRNKGLNNIHRRGDTSRWIRGNSRPNRP